MDAAKPLFRHNPFAATANPERYLAIGSVESARSRIAEAIDGRECPAMLVGPAGTGKSLLCQLIAESYASKFDVVLLSESRLCTRKALLQHLLHHLGLPFAERGEGELRLALIDRATLGIDPAKEGLLIIVDEAQGLPGRLLEELRMISGIVRNGRPKVQLVLAGSSVLDERLAHPRMEPLAQRVGARCYLHPLSQKETFEYVTTSISRAGVASDAVIDEAALREVFLASDGIPRLINQTMSRAIALAGNTASMRITAPIVDQAWAELQQLPSPAPLVSASRSEDHLDHRSNIQRSSADAQTATIEFSFGDDNEETSLPIPQTQRAAPPVEPAVKSPLSASSPVRSHHDKPSADHGPLFDPMAETTEYVPADTQWDVSLPIDELQTYDPTAGKEEAEEDEVVEEFTAFAPTAQRSHSNTAPIQSQLTDYDELFGAGFDEELTIPGSIAHANSNPQIATFAPAISTASSTPQQLLGPSVELDSFEADALVASESRLVLPYTRENDTAEHAVHEEVIALNREAASGLQTFSAVEVPTPILESENASDWNLDSPAITAAEAMQAACSSAALPREKELDAPTLFATPDTQFADDGSVRFAVDRMVAEGSPLKTNPWTPAAIDRGDITVHDDSDLLVIEDELDVEQRPGYLAPRWTNEDVEQDSRADAQAILSRMREG